MNTRIDEIVEGIYRIATWQAPYGITFHQFFIDDERPIHGGSFEQSAFSNYATALRENEFAFRGILLGREIAKAAPM